MIETHFQEAQELLQKVAGDPAFLAAVRSAGDRMVASLSAGGKILSCGNGGSMCDAMHFAEELSGRYRDNRPALAALSISDPSHLSCVGNDYGYDKVFSRYLEALGKPEIGGEVAVGGYAHGQEPGLAEGLCHRGQRCRQDLLFRNSRLIV